jgi:ribosomal protein L23
MQFLPEAIFSTSPTATKTANRAALKFLFGVHFEQVHVCEDARENVIALVPRPAKPVRKNSRVQ